MKHEKAEPGGGGGGGGESGIVKSRVNYKLFIISFLKATFEVGAKTKSSLQ
jgi:hypothetical protein